MAFLRLFGPAREAAGVSRISITGLTVDEVVSEAQVQFGESFAQVVAISNIWLNGDQTELGAIVTEDDEVAIIPPVSGG